MVNLCFDKIFTEEFFPSTAVASLTGNCKPGILKWNFLYMFSHRNKILNYEYGSDYKLKFLIKLIQNNQLIKLLFKA